MSIPNITLVTGSAVTGLTSPTYTMSADSADSYSKQFAVTALGGTQTGVTVHSTSSPFTLTFSRPKSARVPTLVGTQYQVPINTYYARVRKGVNAVAGQPMRIAMIEIRTNIPAGAETLDKANLDAMFSAAAGAFAAQLQGIRDMIANNIL